MQLASSKASCPAGADTAHHDSQWECRNKLTEHLGASINLLGIGTSTLGQQVGKKASSNPTCISNHAARSRRGPSCCAWGWRGRTSSAALSAGPLANRKTSRPGSESREGQRSREGCGAQRYGGRLGEAAGSVQLPTGGCGLCTQITAAGREVTASRSGRAGSGGYEGKLFSQRAVGHRLRRKAGAEEQPRGPLPARARSSARCHTTATRGSAAAQPAAPRPAAPTHISELGQAALPHLAQALVRRAALQEELRQAHRLPAEQRAHGVPGRSGSAQRGRRAAGTAAAPGPAAIAQRPARRLRLPGDGAANRRRESAQLWAQL